MLPLPIRIRKTRQCPRCGLDYPADASACPHCAELSDAQVEDLKRQYAEEGPGERNLGMLFIYIAALLVIGLIVFSISH